MARPNRAFKVTRVKLSEVVTDPKDRMDLEMKFTEFEVARQEAVRVERQAMLARTKFEKAQADLVHARAEATNIYQEFLLKVGERSTEVAAESIWYTFRKAGDVVLESPYGERTQRNMVRAEIALLDQRVRDTTDPSDADLYEEDSSDGNGKDEQN